MNEQAPKLYVKEAISLEFLRNSGFFALLVLRLSLGQRK
jgi:hypothetical protein